MNARTLLTSAVAFVCAPLASGSDWYFTGSYGSGWYTEVWIDTGGGTGYWANNWGQTSPTRPLTYPGAADDVFFNSIGTASLDYASASVRNVDNVAGQLRVENGAVLTVHGASLYNTGVVTIAYGGYAGNGRVDVVGPLALSGTGQLHFAGGSLTGGTVTQSADHLIHGTSGYIDTPLVNHGTVNSDENNGWLQVRGVTTNHGAIKASNNARIELRNTIDQSGTGVIHADGGAVYLVNNTVTGGTLRSGAGSEIQVAGGAVGTVRDLTNEGTLRVPNSNALLALAGSSIVNNGRIISTENTGMGAGQIRVDNDLALVGSGELWTRARLYSDNGSTLTNAPTHTIRYGDVASGDGQLDVSLVNDGLIRSDFANKTIRLRSTPKTNNNRIETANGGLLSIQCPVQQGNAGVIHAANGNVSLSNGSISGGILDTGATSEIQTVGGTVNTLSNLTLYGTVRVPNNGSLLVLAGDITNSGRIISTENTGMGAGKIRVDTNLSLLGSGELWCRTDLYTSNGSILTNAANHTIRYGDEPSGEGRLSVGLLNLGTVRSDYPGKVIALTDALKTNNGLMEATNGGILDLRCTIDQPSGIIAANGGTVRLYGGHVMRGTITSSGSSLIESVGGTTTTFENVTNTGSIKMRNNNSLLSIRGNLTNHGTIELIPNTGMGAGEMRLENDASFLGSGNVIVRSRIYASGAYGLVNGPAHTLSGTGSVNLAFVSNQGIVAPGVSAGTLTVNGPFQQTPLGTLLVELASASSYDRLAVNGAASLAGGLEIALLGGYLPARSATFTVLTAGTRTGTFENVGPFGFIPVVGNLAGFVPQYTSTSAILKSFTRVGDVNLDNTVDNQDIASFVALLTGGGVPSAEQGFAADCNHDGVVNNQDITPFVALLTGGRGVPAGDPDFAPLMGLVPEPASLSLLALGSIVTLRRRRA